VQIDNAFRLSSQAEDGQATVTDEHGVGTRISWDPASAWLQVCTGDRPEPELNRTGLAIEPMTCPPDAFNSANGLIELAPGEHTAVSWTISALEPPDG
jgi:aldose 1-epimerase